MSLPADARLAFAAGAGGLRFGRPAGTLGAAIASYKIKGEPLFFPNANR
jgi:hypothetical protein